MNRLWIRLSLVIAGVAIFIALFPLFSRRLNLPWYAPPQRNLRAELMEIDPALWPERLERFEQRVDERVWWGLWRSVALGAVIGLGAGVLLSHSLAKPLTALEKGATALAGKNLAHRVPERGSREMRAVAQSFNQMAEELGHQESLRRNMLADVTHELRHPVHVLRGNLQGILDGVFPLAPAEIAFLLEQTDQLGQLVNDLHELALAEAQELPLHLQETDVGEVVQQALDAVQPLAVEKSILLSWQRPSTPILVLGDAGRLRQTVQNLLSNSVHYTPEQGEVTLAVTVSDRMVNLVVQDDGMGISGDDLPHVFDRFYRSAASRQRENGGAGLGLAIARAIVLAHNGRIHAASPGPNQGSIFNVTLPLYSPAAT